jgi:hypothetical protein
MHEHDSRPMESEGRRVANRKEYVEVVASCGAQELNLLPE